jgi:hypothetical protein
MSDPALFAIPQNQQIIRTAAAVLSGLSSEHAQKNQAAHLAQALRTIASNADIFDKTCSINVRWLGDQLISYLVEIGNADRIARLDMVTAIVYRFVLEYDLSVPGELSMELNSFKNFINDNYTDFELDAKRQIDFARRDMPLSMFKIMLNSDEIGSLRNIAGIAQETHQKIDGWQESLAKSEKTVTDLQTTLERQKDAFNFVGLHKGFSELAGQVSDELTAARKSMFIFGLLVLLPAAAELVGISAGVIDLSKIGVISIGAAAAASISIMFLFLYFFRIALRSADSCKAQLVQVRLRMALCAFIQSYAEYSKEIKGSNPDALAKFEALIFSGLVATSDRIPSTFDGIDQLSGLIKSVGAKS